MLAKKRLITFRVLISQIANSLHPNDQFLTDITQNRLCKRFRESRQKIPMLFLMESLFELKPNA